MADAVIEGRRYAAARSGADERVRDEADALAVTDEVMHREDVEQRLKRLHQQTVRVDPEAAISLEEERADVVRTVRSTESGQVDVAVTIAQAIEGLGREQAHSRRVRGDRSAASADPGWAGTFPIAPNGQPLTWPRAGSAVRPGERTRRGGDGRKLLDEPGRFAHGPDTAP